MRIFDGHLHLPPSPGVDLVPWSRQILEVMDQTGIERSVGFAIKTTTQRSVEVAEKAARLFSGRLVPYAYALASYERPALKELDRAICGKGFRGIKVHAAESPLAEHAVDPVVELAARRRVPCLIDCDGNFADAERLAAKFPRARLVLAHMGKYLCTDADRINRFIAVAERHENVLLETSGMALLWKVEDAAARIGADRLIFGTDGPNQAPTALAYAIREVNKVSMLSLTEPQKADVFSNTLARLLGME